MALLASNSSKPGVSVELNTSYLAAAEVGSRLRIEGTALRIGKRLGFTEVKLSDERTGRLIAVGRHTKAFPGE
jgi:acyl-coenzyme A thioesterase 13